MKLILNRAGNIRIGYYLRNLPFVLVALLLLSVSPAQAQTLQTQGFQANFELELSSPLEHTQSSGHIEYLDAANVFLEVSKPIRQEIRFSSSLASYYYPEEKRVVEQKGDGKAPLLSIDSLSTGIHPLNAKAVKGATMVARTRTLEGKLREQWRIADEKGQSSTTLVTVEGQGGLEALVVLNEKDEVLRRYNFGPRVVVGTLRIPERCVAEYRDSSGGISRIETWKLMNIAQLPLIGKRKVGAPVVWPSETKVDTVD